MYHKPNKDVVRFFFSTARQLDYKVHLEVQQANVGRGNEKGGEEGRKQILKTIYNNVLRMHPLHTQINPEIETIAYGNL